MKAKRNINKIRSLALFTVVMVMFHAGPALADHDLQSNINMVAEEMARWSKQCGAKPLTPEAQAKLSELLIETSELLKQIAANTDAKMHTVYHRKLETMKAEWDPFDTIYGN